MTERDIFHAAMEIADPAERSAYLEKVCAGDPSLRRDVEGMLQVYPQLGTFLEFPVVDLDSATRPPVNAGRFQLGQELARGGMGVVYRARDESLGRDVAVKVLHERYLVDSLVGQRFLDEARITAQLQHPGIPPVFEVGRLADGRPYLAMKFVKGRTLEDLLKERAEPASDRGHFLAVFHQVCQAVGYAHSKHILHRDLKPANVMVGTFGEVQVMDWGLAKLLQPGGAAAHKPADTQAPCGTVIQTAREPDAATLAGSMLGTPAFMAPEQAGGEVDRIDERTDVFGLGAILCVLLTGEPPYTGKSGDEIRLKAIRGTLADAHARLAQCGADAKLVALCRACLAPEREARPGDAGAVAATIAGYLSDVEERARQAERERAAAEARAAEQRKRRRVQFALAATVLLALLGGITGTTWGLLLIVAERDAKDAALKAEQEARADETKARQHAFAALRSMTADVVERKFGQGTVLTEDDRAFLRGVIAQYDAFANIKGDDADSRAARAEGRFRVGKMRCRLGEFQEAEQDFDQALSIRTQLAADFPSRADFRQDLAQCHLQRGELRFGSSHASSQSKEAEQDYDQALTILKQLAADFPAEPEFRQDLASGHINRGILLCYASRRKEAEQEFDDALTILKQLAADFPTRFEFRQKLAAVHFNRGNLLQETSRPQEAEKEYDKALSIHKQLAADFPSRPDFRLALAFTHMSRAALRHITGRLKEAEQDYDQAVRIQKQLAADFPAQPGFRQALGLSYSNRGELHSAMDRLQEAEQDFTQTLSLWKQTAADFPTRPRFRKDLAFIENNLGRLLARQKRFAEAFNSLNAALASGKELLAADPKNPEYTNVLGYSHAYRGWALVRSGQPSQAGADLRRAVELFAKEQSPDPGSRFEQSHVLALLAGLGGVKNSGVTPAEAIGFADQAVAALHDAVGAGWAITDDLKQPDFDALRDRDDFKKLVVKLEGKPK